MHVHWTFANVEIFSFATFCRKCEKIESAKWHKQHHPRRSCPGRARPSSRRGFGLPLEYSLDLFSRFRYRIRLNVRPDRQSWANLGVFTNDARLIHPKNNSLEIFLSFRHRKRLNARPYSQFWTNPGVFTDDAKPIHQLPFQDCLSKDSVPLCFRIYPRTFDEDSFVPGSTFFGTLSETVSNFIFQNFYLFISIPTPSRARVILSVIFSI